MQPNPKLKTPQIKVCGLTDPDQARACAELGADAVGLVFYPPSPRHLSLERAAEVAAALPPGVPAVGVFVNPDPEELAHILKRCRLGALQLHGAEAPEQVRLIASRFGLPVIKALFAARHPGLEDADLYTADAFLVECGRGRLPGGNAETWDWGRAEALARRLPTVLAGGLGPDNAADAVAACRPDAVDASSGLEEYPGRKDLDKVARFIAAVRGTAQLYASADKPIRPVFSRP